MCWITNFIGEELQAITNKSCLPAFQVDPLRINNPKTIKEMMPNSPTFQACQAKMSDSQGPTCWPRNYGPTGLSDSPGRCCSPPGPRREQPCALPQSLSPVPGAGLMPARGLIKERPNCSLGRLHSPSDRLGQVRG